ncbi:MAG: SLC13 family permease [Anaerolineales bacterium]
MTFDNYLVLGIMGLSLVLFLSERLRVDVVALLTMLALTLSRLLSPEEAFSGFSNPAVITVWAIFIVSGGVVRSGLADRMAHFITRIAGTNYFRLLLLTMLITGLMSGFMNDIGAMAILLPAIVSVAAQAEIPPSRLLIPMAWASLLGGNLTSIGSPPNILVNGILADYTTFAPLAFFDFLPLGIIVLGTALLYMLLIGFRMLPDRGVKKAPAIAYHLDDHLAELRIGQDSPLAGALLADTALGRLYDVQVLHIYAVDGHTLFANPGRRLSAGDILIVQGLPYELTRLCRERGLVMLTRRPVQDLESAAKDREGVGMAEVVIPPKSALQNKTLRQVDFRVRYGLTVMAIRRQTDHFVHRLADEPLRSGDVLLVEGPRVRLSALRHEADLLPLGVAQDNHTPRDHDKEPLVLGIIALVLLFAVTEWVHIGVAMLLGGLAMVLFGVLSMDDAIAAIDWKSVFLVAGMLPLGLAMQKTGTALLLAQSVTGLLDHLGPMAVLMGVYVLTVILTTGMSNAAVAVLMAPIALDVAHTLGASPYPFVLAVIVAASCAFILPVGHQVNIIIMGPGEYRFSDFALVGLGLNLVLLVVLAFTLPTLWPLYP